MSTLVGLRCDTSRTMGKPCANSVGWLVERNVLTPYLWAVLIYNTAQGLSHSSRVVFLKSAQLAPPHTQRNSLTLP